jgi:uncharacterized membrane protein
MERSLMRIYPLSATASPTTEDLKTRQTRDPRSSAAAIRVSAAIVLGILAGASAAQVLAWQIAELVGWNAAAASYLAAVWTTIAGPDAGATKCLALREDPSVPASELILLSASVACLGGVGMALLKAGQTSGGIKAALISMGVLSVLTAWGTVHTIYTLRYARLYYSGAGGGINFNGDEAPTFLDFAYVAFTIGMTFQVSDTNLTRPALRREAMRHALLSYLFGVVIVGMTINIVAGLLR